MNELPTQSPLYHAQHSDRYNRQALIRQYEDGTGARLLVVIDTIGPRSITYLEELLYDASPEDDLHLLLDTPGGDGEIAVRMVRSLHSRCQRLTVIVPDAAKSAGSLLAMGAHEILMGPTSDLGPVDPQLHIPHASQHWVAAKDLVAAVDGALAQVQTQPKAGPLMASLLSDVNYLMYQQAKSAIERTDDLMERALASNPDRSSREVTHLFDRLKPVMIADPKVHWEMFGYEEARAADLPVTSPDPAGQQWQMIWRLWTKYFGLRDGWTRIYENRTASQVISVK